MLKTIKICDRCNQEADWLYRVPWIRIEERDLIIDTGKKELCYKCMSNLCELVFNYHNLKGDFVSDSENE